MKKHDWLNKADVPTAADKLEKNRRSEAFEQVAADPGKHWNKVGFQALISWEQVGVKSKIEFIGMYAAMYDVPYDR